nr:4-phosphopantetheinyl transferase [uncultured bacterium]
MIECAVRWSPPLPAEPRFLALLDDVEQGRYTGYRQDIDKRRFLTGRVLAKTVTAERLGVAVEDVTFDATCADCGKPHGRPRVPGAPLMLSISHSGDLIGVAQPRACRSAWTSKRRPGARTTRSSSTR